MVPYKNDLKLHLQLQNGFNCMWLWLVTIVSLYKNEDESVIVSTNNNENLIACVPNNVVHRWLDTMWHLVQFEL